MILIQMHQQLARYLSVFTSSIIAKKVGIQSISLGLSFEWHIFINSCHWILILLQQLFKVIFNHVRPSPTLRQNPSNPPSKLLQPYAILPHLLLFCAVFFFCVRSTAGKNLRYSHFYYEISVVNSIFIGIFSRFFNFLIYIKISSIRKIYHIWLYIMFNKYKV